MLGIGIMADTAGIGNPKSVTLVRYQSIMDEETPTCRHILAATTIF
jgi:hypothetical protein